MPYGTATVSFVVLRAATGGAGVALPISMTLAAVLAAQNVTDVLLQLQNRT